MAKVGLWLTEELEEQIGELHGRMLKDPLLRELKVSKSDVLRLLLQRALPFVRMEHELWPRETDGSGPTDLKELRKQLKKMDAALRRMERKEELDDFDED